MQNKNEIQEVSKKTGISVKELNRLNQDFWYHGTTLKDAENIRENGVIASYNCERMLDFGTGFYLTDTHQRASNYISRVPVITASGGLERRKEWAVVEFMFNPCKLLFCNENQYLYRNFPKHNEEFAEYVFHNRIDCVEGYKTYDLIWGVMSDSIPSEAIIDYKKGKIPYEEVIKVLQKPNSMRQLYIGNQVICDMLVLNNVYIEEECEDAKRIYS